MNWEGGGGGGVEVINGVRGLGGVGKKRSWGGGGGRWADK